ncbi:hypothetical protein [Stakelama marina]|uniref:Uncharacterized protein n=1 Tax=Stakelama marina TaxID=2826939 RepID=A0A8T4IE45_9SPHN|nr:hypothetical protein [Stakelama marina]MBR0552124.1 hypothetical protein [Stakelama marina]
MRPKSIVRFEIFYLLSIAVGLISTAINWNTGLEKVQQSSPEAAAFYPAMVAGGAAISILISLLLWYFTARRASNVARWILTVFFGLSILSLLYTLSTGQFPGGLAGIVAVTSYILNALAVVMLFQPDANAWFKRDTPPAQDAETFE